jgi:macrodomain Ter protein organizer (MatP/YcbG family)
VRQYVRSHRETVHLTRSRANLRRLRAAHSEIEAAIAPAHAQRRLGARRTRAGRPERTIARMKELELKLSLPDQLASQAKAAGLLTSEAIERLVRQAIRKAAAERLIEYGKRLREPGAPEITEAELESELKAVRAELREARARGT